MIRALAMGVLFMAVFGVPDAVAQVATGCLTRGGKIISLAIGDEPARPCSFRQTEISLRLEGGDQGGSEFGVVPFYITLDGDGSEEAVVTNGPLEIFARCELNKPDPFGSGNIDIVTIVATSSEDGWFGAGWRTQDVPQPLSAGDELTFIRTRSLNPGAAHYLLPSQPEGGSVTAPDGSYVGIDGSIGLGLNVFGHDCIAIGTATVITGDLE